MPPQLWYHSDKILYASCLRFLPCAVDITLSCFLVLALLFPLALLPTAFRLTPPRIGIAAAAALVDVAKQHLHTQAEQARPGRRNGQCAATALVEGRSGAGRADRGGGQASVLGVLVLGPLRLEGCRRRRRRRRLQQKPSLFYGGRAAPSSTPGPAAAAVGDLATLSELRLAIMIHFLFRVLVIAVRAAIFFLATIATAYPKAGEY